MIEVQYKGRLGNHLFQYCCGRILAQELGYSLKAETIPGFPETKNNVEGKDYSDMPPLYLSEDFVSRVDIPTIIREHPKRKIILNGYFQNYSFYEPYKEAIKDEWLRMEEPSLAVVPSTKDLVMHVRRGDSLHFSGFTLPLSHYEGILNTIDYDRLFVLSDNPKDPFFTHFNKYQPTMIHCDMFTDFCFIKSANNIAISLGTYSWWAAFLSRAENIFFPIPIPCEFPWLPLQVPEDRYISIPCYEKYKRKARENVNHAIWITRKITRHLKNPKKFASTAVAKATR